MLFSTQTKVTTVVESLYSRHPWDRKSVPNRVMSSFHGIKSGFHLENVSIEGELTVINRQCRGLIKGEAL